MLYLALYVHHLTRLVGLATDPLSAATLASFIAYSAVFLLLAGGLIFAVGALSERAAAVLAVALALAMFIDVRVYEMLGVHLYSPVSLDALNNPGVGREFQLGTGTWLAFFGLVVVGLASELGLMHVLRLRLSGRTDSAGLVRRLAAGLGGLLVACLVVTAVLWPREPTASDRLLVDAMPLYQLVFGQTGFDPEEVGVAYPGDVGESPRLSRRPSIVFVQVESLRADAFTDVLMPRARAFANANGCITSQRHYSGAHTTEFGTFALLYGLDSYHFPPFAPKEVPSYPLTVLEDNGYRTLGRSGSALKDWNDAGFVVDQLGDYEEFLDEKTHEGDRRVVDSVTAFAAERDAAQPFFLFVFLNATHHNYMYPPEHERFTPVMASDYNHFLGDDALAEHREKITNRYKNAVGYVDALFGEITAAFSEQVARGELIVVLTGDHGEEFWEHGLLGHAASTFVDERIRVPLVLCIPSQEPRELTLSGHVDVWPTVLASLGPQPAAPSSTWSNGASLLGDVAGSERVFVGGLDFPYRSRSAWIADAASAHRVELCSGPTLCSTAPKAALEALRTRMGRFLTFSW